jgi:hypothetical protein
MPRKRHTRTLGSTNLSQGNSDAHESVPSFSAPLPETAEACASEMQRLEEQEKLIMDRLKLVTAQLQKLLHKKPNPNEEELGEMKTSSTDMGKRSSDLVGNNENEEVHCEQGMDLPIEVYKLNGAEDENMASELSSPLISAIKKLHARSDQKRELKMWAQNLANLFYHNDEDGSGYIDEKEYQHMLDRLDISEQLKLSLREKFNSIDKDGQGINLTEFLLFFLNYPMFRKELQTNAHNNAPYTYENTLTKTQLWRQWLYCVIEHPEYNIASKILFCTDLILTSVPIVILCMEGAQSSLEVIWFRDSYMWFISIFFAVKYFIGLTMCKYKTKFIFDVIHMFELLSFLFWIYYNTVGEPGTLDPMGFVVFRLIRFIDLHKVFKIAALEEDIAIYVNVLKLAYTSSGAVLMLLVFSIFFFSLLMYVFERGLYEEVNKTWLREGEESPFSDMSACIYFVLVTMTTLGYGDMYPVSYVGRMVAMITVFVGLCNITFLINIVGDCFEEVFREYVLKKSKQMQEEHRMYLTDCVQGAEAGSHSWMTRSHSWMTFRKRSKRMRNLKTLQSANEVELR